MNHVPQLPDNAPFTAEQRAWLNGWIAGSMAVRISIPDSGAAPAALPAPALLPLTILFGSQTGSAEGLAKKLAKHAAAQGFLPTVLGMDAAASLDLTQCSRLLVLTSTYGDGEPPDNAAAFWTNLTTPDAPALPATAFSVFALGDSNYEKFCAFGLALDQRLEALGARRITDRVDCDVDYDAPFAAWMPHALSGLKDSAETPPAAATIEVLSPAFDLTETPAPSGTKANPFAALLTANELLTTDTAAKETRHFALNINGLHYEPGDALGIFPTNSPDLVQAIIEAGRWSVDEAALESLTSQFDLTNPSRDLLAFAASRHAGGELDSLLKPARSADLKAWLHGRDVLDVLRL
ncbi:MAG: sulfite reductase subunit alpha, partial [Verrucomicrobiales bacterium]|nr:sulfite reductase subunit alpha [Verrucomicrobiales bacterium]